MDRVKKKPPAATVVSVNGPSSKHAPKSSTDELDGKSSATPSNGLVNGEKCKSKKRGKGATNNNNTTVVLKNESICDVVSNPSGIEDGSKNGTSLNNGTTNGQLNQSDLTSKSSRRRRSRAKSNKKSVSNDTTAIKQDVPSSEQVDSITEAALAETTVSNSLESQATECCTPTDFSSVLEGVKTLEIKEETPSSSSGATTNDLSLESKTQIEEVTLEEKDHCDITYVQYESELQMPLIMKIIQKDLSEPYSIYTYRYFIHNWPKLCYLAMCEDKCVGAIVCKLDFHRKSVKRGYIAMLAVDQNYRKRSIGSTLVRRAITEMIAGSADEVVLETEVTNKPALRLYEQLGFVRDKRLFRYYLNGVDALRLKLWLR